MKLREARVSGTIHNRATRRTETTKCRYVRRRRRHCPKSTCRFRRGRPCNDVANRRTYVNTYVGTYVCTNVSGLSNVLPYVLTSSEQCQRHSHEDTTTTMLLQARRQKQPLDNEPRCRTKSHIIRTTRRMAWHDTTYIGLFPRAAACPTRALAPPFCRTEDPLRFALLELCFLFRAFARPPPADKFFFRARAATSHGLVERAACTRAGKR